ncbi:MAG TPA: hypothetical protein VMT22_05025 [Terriglobales bacterium]|jgi:hypothetical protein|nr:hypothetical protein [Terriglobales bacterium]
MPVGNVKRFYLEFQGTPRATIETKEILNAREQYLTGKDWARRSFSLV